MAFEAGFGLVESPEVSMILGGGTRERHQTRILDERERRGGSLWFCREEEQIHCLKAESKEKRLYDNVATESGEKHRVEKTQPNHVSLFSNRPYRLT